MADQLKVAPIQSVIATRPKSSGTNPLSPEQLLKAVKTVRDSMQGQSAKHTSQQIEEAYSMLRTSQDRLGLPSNRPVNSAYSLFELKEAEARLQAGQQTRTLFERTAGRTVIDSTTIPNSSSYLDEHRSGEKPGPTIFQAQPERQQRAIAEETDRLMSESEPETPPASYSTPSPQSLSPSQLVSSLGPPVYPNIGDDRPTYIQEQPSSYDQPGMGFGDRLQLIDNALQLTGRPGIKEGFGQLLRSQGLWGGGATSVGGGSAVVGAETAVAATGVGTTVAAEAGAGALATGVGGAAAGAGVGMTTLAGGAVATTAGGGLVAALAAVGWVALVVLLVVAVIILMAVIIAGPVREALMNYIPVDPTISTDLSRRRSVTYPGSFCWPVTGTISDGGSPEDHGPDRVTGNQGSAIDISASIGTPVSLTLNGCTARFLDAGTVDYGKYVELSDCSDFTGTLIYAHLQAFGADAEGQSFQVNRRYENLTEGAVLGYVNSTGNSTGDHLHLEYVGADLYAIFSVFPDPRNSISPNAITAANQCPGGANGTNN